MPVSGSCSANRCKVVSSTPRSRTWRKQRRKVSTLSESRTSQSLTPGGPWAGSCSSSITMGRSQRPGAGCNSGVVNNTAERSSMNRQLTASQVGALIKTTAPANGARHSRNTADHSDPSAKSSKRNGSTGVDKLAP
ncbi:hypothetical protein D3C81_1702140 [compost metagenome]